MARAASPNNAKAKVPASPKLKAKEEENNDVDAKAEQEQEEEETTSSSEKATAKSNSFIGPVLIIVGVVIAAASVFMAIQEKVPSGGAYESLKGVVPQPRISSTPMDAMPGVPHTLHIHPNGFLNTTKTISTGDYAHLDDVMSSVCPSLEFLDSRLFATRSGARLYKSNGLRVWSLAETIPEDHIHCVSQGRLFHWPLLEIGQEWFPASVVSPVKGKRIVMKQLSGRPRVISVANFMTPEELKELLDYNRDRVTPSEVGFTGVTGDSTRTSSTSWDFHSKAAIAIQKRSFEVLGLDYIPAHADALQVLNYKPKQWYKPHVDWFNKEAYTKWDSGVNNGTNRFATVFLYLSTVEKGGSTVFPLARDHEGYNGEVITHDGTVNTPGYINTKEAHRACNETSTALKSRPIAGNAVIFYSQGPDSQLDPYSLHGGCPPLEGEKWSANVWIWNRAKPGKDEALDKKGKEAAPPGQIEVLFRNVYHRPLEINWFNPDTKSLTPYGVIKPEDGYPMNSFMGHTFVFRDLEEKTEVFRFTVSDADGGDTPIPQ